MLSGTWGGSLSKMPPVVGPDELLSSFVRRNNEVDRKLNTIHPSRLIPRRSGKNRRLELSVCRSTELSEAQVWDICARFFDPRTQPAIGRGVGPASAAYSEALGFDADGEPYPEHANVVGWHEEPGKPDSELKHYWMAQSQRMAAKFAYKPRG